MVDGVRAGGTAVLAPADQEAGLVRLMVVDDHEMVRETIAERLNREPDLDVVATAATAAEAMVRFKATRPDVTLLDYRLPDADGDRLLRDLLVEDPDAVVVMLSGHDEVAMVAGALTAGARGFITKGSPASTLVAAVRQAAAGGTALDPVTAARTVHALAGARAGRVSVPVGAQRQAAAAGELTRREVQVLTLVADGRSNQQIASELGISLDTVKTHMSRIFQRLGVRDRAQAAAWAVRNNLI